jgi:chaperonin GroEL (HSP60 family)
MRDPFYKVTPEIIDPMRVTRCALQNAISVTKTLLTMESVVLNDRLWT